MSDWGRVAFYYDYKKPEFRGERKRVQGLISRAYKYPGVMGMILHAYYGLGYFLTRYDHDYIDFDGSGWDDTMGDYAELNTAFDVFFDVWHIAIGSDSVRRVLEAGNTGDDEKMTNSLFNCEGSYGWLFLKFTEDETGERVLKYGYFYGDVEEFKVVDLKTAVEIERTRRPGNENLDREELKEAIDTIQESGTLMSEEEFWAMEDLGLIWVKSQFSGKA